jgi:hypothetical protein
VRQQEVSRNLIEATVAKDDNDRRFERFCADLFSVRDGISYETTAPTGDEGVDARAQVTLAEGVSVVCATTQRKGVKIKAISDVDKQARREKRLARLHICVAQDVNEATLDEIREYAAQHLPRTEIEVHGRSGLSDIAFRYQRPFLDNYRRELDEHTLWLKQKSDDFEDVNQVNLLRIAVTTVFDPEILKQRQLITDSLIITALGDGTPKTAQQISATVANGLKLERAPHSSYLLTSIESLCQRFLLEKTRFGLRLTRLGHELREQLIAQGVTSSLDGRAAFRALLGELPAGSLTAEDFSRLWRAVQLKLSKLFLNNGLRVVAELQSIAAGEPNAVAPVGPGGILSSAVYGLLADVEGLHLNDLVANRVAEVLREMLVNNQTDAFRWISELGIKYVVICSLGLDPELERRLQEQVANWILIPDTHVVLSYLCPGDEGHESCVAILEQLRRLGTSIWAMEPVVEEAAHHAGIADRSYRDWFERVRQVRINIPDAQPTDLLQETDNAFVKGFAHTVGGSFNQSDWSDYIQQFRGPGGHDFWPLTEILEQEVGCQFKEDAPEVANVGRAFASTVLQLNEREVSPATTLRCEWDGRLLASVVIYRKSESATRRLIVMSDSDRLRQFLYKNVTPDRRHGLKIADPAAIACALAVVPGTSVNLNCVRHFLFNAGVLLPEYLYESSTLAQAFSSARVLRNPALRERLEEAIMSSGTGLRQP